MWEASLSAHCHVFIAKLQRYIFKISFLKTLFLIEQPFQTPIVNKRRSFPIGKESFVGQAGHGEKPNSDQQQQTNVQLTKYVK